MTTYTAIANSEIDTDSPVTESLMTRVRDNPVAITEGSAGAPQIQNAAIATDAVRAAQIQAGAVGSSEIAASAVHTSELYTLSASTSTTSQFFNFTMTGGMYVFAIQARTNNATYPAYAYGHTTTSDTNVTTAATAFITAMSGGATTSGTAYYQWRYVAASPPHDMGDGDIPAFIYAVIDNTTGDVESISLSAEPVWLANGPTVAMPDFVRDGKKIKIVKQIPESFAALEKVECLIATAELPDVEVEITGDMVHADMDLIPHPFQGNDLAGKTVVMLDPISIAVRNLFELDKAGEDIHEIIRNKYITIGNTALNRVTPKGLLIPSAEWKTKIK